jgi:DNA-binding response OmpR family regulator
MDMRMPVLDGYAATPNIRALPGGEDVKIVAITASALVEQREEILAVGCDDVVRKPFREHEIFEAMARFLDIEYIYEQAGKAAPTRRHGVELTAAMLAELPPELLQELRETTLALNREATLAVIERIGDRAPEVTAGLRELVDNFQTGRLRQLLVETEQHNDD